MRNSTIVILCAFALAAGAAAPAMRVLKAGSAGMPLLVDGDFEALRPEVASRWQPWQRGFRAAPAAGRTNSQCILCERQDGDGEYGASQTLVLNRTNLAPFVISGWSKADGVSGSPDSGYALYVDLTYADGTPLWGQTVNFNCGTHDWQRREFVLMPDKPVKSLTLHCLFRGHTGKVWFDDVSLTELPTPAGACLFQGVPLEQVAAQTPAPQAPVRALETQDGLKLSLNDYALSSLHAGGKELSSGAPSGFLVRDVAANSDFFAFTQGGCAELGLRCHADYAANPDHVAIEGSVTDLTGKDRALTLLFAVAIDASRWNWGDDVRTSRVIDGRGEFDNTVHLRCGANGKMSRYPFAAIWNQAAGLALALDMDHPAQNRLVYHAGTKQFFIAYDFGLSKATRKSPSSASFRFVLYRFDPQWGFRAALQKYYEIFAKSFVKRVGREGVWMPFTDIAKVPKFEDFGFAFQEGAPNVAFDDQHDITSFIYVEPMSHWLAMPREAPRTYGGAMAVLREDLTGSRGQSSKEMAAATLTSGIQSADGQFVLHLQKAPWCDGGVFSLNPDPDIATTPEQPFNKAMVMHQAIASAFKRSSRANPTNAPAAGLDGVYLDSFEMSAGELNYRSEHFATADVPLVFDPAGRPCQLMIFNTWKFARNLATEMHARGKLMFANAVLSQFSFPAPLLDVLGIEVNWMHNGRYSPDPDAVMNFRRALSGQKPYCLLMNTDFSKFTPDHVTRYFERCLFYGIWPGFFDEEAASKDPYWASRNQWFERDRSLFKAYIPLLRRTTAAGWHPVTHASSSNPKILLERFGPGADGAIFLTLHNETAETQTGTLTVDFKTIGLKPATSARELISNHVLARSGENWSVSLDPQQTELFCFEKTE